MSAILNDNSMDYRSERCPFTSQNSIDFTFNTSEIFSNIKNPKNLDPYRPVEYHAPIPQNVLKPSNKQNFDSTADIFDQLTFTPLKSAPTKNEKLDKGPQIILSVHSESDMEDSLDNKYDSNENTTHSIVCVTSTQPPNKWLTIDTQRALDSNFVDNNDDYSEAQVQQNKKIPNTSSPKEFNSPNFTINTEFSRISDLSFLPQRFSTEKKVFPLTNNETQDLLDGMGSDTFTKDSPYHNPYPSLEPQLSQVYTEVRPPSYQPKVCRQSLFRDFQLHREMSEKKYYKLQNCESDMWQNNLRADIRSPPRSITPPLQSIPEESSHFYDTQFLDRTDKQNTFTINRTFEKPDRGSISHSTRESWSKKAVRAEPELWKVPVLTAKRAAKNKTKKDIPSDNNATFEANKTAQNMSLSLVNNVYSQSLTVDPFLSATYFYDEEAVEKFETEFKRWLNYILTPPADLDSNVEQKIDVGKAWIENRNKEVPAAPTKEQVCSNYHNSHRLQSLRRAARALIKTPEIAQVFLKLNAQIEKKLIAIRTDRNLHLDIGLQKAIMELLLSYNPLWLRLGLEAIYGIMIPLRSNNDIEGLTTFIIQRMFKNPFLKNKNTKSNAPNMLLPAYMDAIKKFTLKKFFMLVFFLDQAKQRKLIPHDPCLFCRNALCKESREVIIRFTREVIAGIGDITRHLRPLGYVVSHKQSYLDEYKFAVHNIAVDIRDGVRLTKVMEIILIKNGLLNQLRTPAISRLQKIHNVQLALNALKEANFTIDGDITANDIADGHREKTLSLLWQLIHVFRAPLFVTAANVIQTWWRKKYEVIVAKRKEEERERQRQNNAASIIQWWWRKIQYNRLVEWKMQQITTATIIVQKYCRMWLCRTRLRKLKISVLKIEDWYRTVKLMREAKGILEKLRLEKEELRCRSAIKIQSCVRTWLAVRRYRSVTKKVVLIQSTIRCYLVRKSYLALQKAVRYIQEKYRGKLSMKEDMRRLHEKRRSAVIIQSFYRMLQQRRLFCKLKRSVKTVEERYIALIEMRKRRLHFLKLKQSAIKLQSLYRGKRDRLQFIKERDSIIKLQRRVRARQQMKQERAKYLKTRKATIILQSHIRAYLAMKEQKSQYNAKRNAVFVIQKHFRSRLLTKSQRDRFIKLRNATIVIQKHYRCLMAMRKAKAEYMNLKNAVITMQRRYRAQLAMRESRTQYQKLRVACISIQQRFRANLQMRHLRTQYQKLKYSTVLIQNALRAQSMGKKQRQDFLRKKDAAITLQRWLRRRAQTKQVQKQYQETKQACVMIQRIYRAYILGKNQRQEYLRIKTATICIQKYYRLYVEMKIVREHYIQLKTSTVKIQRFYRSHVLTKRQQEDYRRIRAASVRIQTYYRRYKETQRIRREYVELRKASICFQRRYRSLCQMKQQRSEYLKLKNAVLTVQRRYRSLACMRKHKDSYDKLHSAAIILQRRFRAKMAMRKEQEKYFRIRTACMRIQEAYRSYLIGRQQRQKYLKLKLFTLKVQQRYRAILAMRVQRNIYENLHKAAIVIQRRYRAQRLMMEERAKFRNIVSACCVIQTRYRAYLLGKKQMEEYNRLKIATVTIQNTYRLMKESRKIREEYLHLKSSVILMQRRFRANKVAQKCRTNYLKLKKSAVIIQSTYRMHIYRKQYLIIKDAALCIQKHFRAYKLAQTERKKYIQMRNSIIKSQAQIRCYLQRKRYLKLRSAAQTLQRAYRLKKQRDALKKLRKVSATCIQKYTRRYLVQRRYENFRKQVITVQKLWRSKLYTRLIRCGYVQKRNMVIKLQAAARGYLLRKRVQRQKEELEAAREKKRVNQAASKIQVSFFLLSACRHCPLTMSKELPALLSLILRLKLQI